LSDTLFHFSDMCSANTFSFPRFQIWAYNSRPCIEKIRTQASDERKLQKFIQLKYIYLYVCITYICRVIASSFRPSLYGSWRKIVVAAVKNVLKRIYKDNRSTLTTQISITQLTSHYTYIVYGIVYDIYYYIAHRHKPLYKHKHACNTAYTYADVCRMRQLTYAVCGVACVQHHLQQPQNCATNTC
jgi:hypothetical protein